MHVLHEHEEPNFPVFRCFLETGERGCLGGSADGVALDAGGREEAFFGGEPFGVQGIVW